MAPGICRQQILYRCWAQICTDRGWGSSNNMGIRQMPYVRHGFPKRHSGHRPWTTDRNLKKIQNPRLFPLKEKTLRYRFTIQHCLGKWHRGPDAVFRRPVAMVQALLDVFPAKPTESDILESNNISDITESTALIAIFAGSNYIAMISPDLIRAVGRSDP